MITLLTCTGDRQHLFARLERWMVRQSVRWTDWIVVDDGQTPTACTQQQHYVRLESGLSPRESFARNMETALREYQSRKLTGYVFVIEDDDWYGPNYLASTLTGLLTHDLVGEPQAPFYYLPKMSYQVCGNRHYSALCATGFRHHLIPQILPLIDPTDTELDRRIWEQINCSKLLKRTRHCVGLKGQGGRPGLCAGHVPRGYRPDPEGIILNKWIKEDTVEVLSLFEKITGPVP